RLPRSPRRASARRRHLQTAPRRSRPRAAPRATPHRHPAGRRLPPLPRAPDVKPPCAAPTRSATGRQRVGTAVVASPDLALVRSLHGRLSRIIAGEGLGGTSKKGARGAAMRDEECVRRTRIGALLLCDRRYCFE